MTGLAVVDAPPAAADPCWETVGVRGDGSCPRLAEVTHCRNCPVYTAAGRALADRPPPAGYTAEWTARLAAADPPPPPPTVSVVLFRVGAEWLALDVAHAVEVAPTRPVRRVPHAAGDVLAGLVNLRGELQLAVRLGGLLGATAALDGAKADAGRLLVIEAGGVRWVVLADEVHDIHHVPAADIRPVPATVAAGVAPLTRGVFRWAGHAVGLVDPARLFTALGGATR